MTRGSVHWYISMFPARRGMSAVKSLGVCSLASGWLGGGGQCGHPLPLFGLSKTVDGAAQSCLVTRLTYCSPLAFTRGATPELVLRSDWADAVLPCGGCGRGRAVAFAVHDGLLSLPGRFAGFLFLPLRPAPPPCSCPSPWSDLTGAAGVVPTRQHFRSLGFETPSASAMCLVMPIRATNSSGWQRSSSCMTHSDMNESASIQSFARARSSAPKTGLALVARGK